MDHTVAWLTPDGLQRNSMNSIAIARGADYSHDHMLPMRRLPLGVRNHPERPWQAPRACDCGGAGAPCAVCNRSDAGTVPDLPEGSSSTLWPTKIRTCRNRRRSAAVKFAEGQMCNLYYADLWIMPTIDSERALAVAIAALESA
jgi:hypothetical protein